MIGVGGLVGGLAARLVGWFVSWQVSSLVWCLVDWRGGRDGVSAQMHAFARLISVFPSQRYETILLLFIDYRYVCYIGMIHP